MMNEELKELASASLTAADRPNSPVFLQDAGRLLSRLRPHHPNQLLSSRYDVSEPGAAVSFRAASLAYELVSEKPTQEPNHDGSGGVSGSLMDGRRTSKVCCVGWC